MKRLPKLATITAAASLFVAVDASAGLKCALTEYIDVRGDSSLSSILTDDGLVTIAEVAVANSALGGNPNGGLTQLVDAVVAADLVGALDDTSADLTVFAPIDSAFAAIPADVLGGIVDSGALPSVLLYHVLAGSVDPRDGRRLTDFETLLGQNVFVKRSRMNPTINNSEIDCQGIVTDNGLVWLIDSVLVPQF